MPRARWEALARKRAKRGLKTKRVSDEVHLLDRLWLPWDGWEELALSRPFKPGGEPQSILHSEIVHWLDLNLIRGQDRRRQIYRAIKVLDIAWLAEINDRKPKASTTQDSKNGNPPSSTERERVRVIGQARR